MLRAIAFNIGLYPSRPFIIAVLLIFKYTAHPIVLFPWQVITKAFLDIKICNLPTELLNIFVVVSLQLCKNIDAV